jgi:hypothetical protein
MMKSVMILLSLCYGVVSLVSGNGTGPVKPLMENFLGTDWPAVLDAKEKIENTEAACIDDLIAVMNDCRISKLQNTGDLIYPGAEKYFGHGQIIDYDIDDCCVRAGWLLEDLTFRNFGFTGIHLPDKELDGFIRTCFPEYTDNPANLTHLEQLTSSGKRKLIRTLSIERVKNWWKAASKNWSRLDALDEALNSQDEKCQVKALFYIRYGTTRCSGLNEKYYKTHLESSIRKLSKAELSRVSEHAKLILLDNDADWLSIKPAD